MNCPRCNTNLAISNTQGIEIDYCPNCRGVWLDRGELEKIIERSNQFSTPFLGHGHRSEHHESHHEKYQHDYNNGNHSNHKKGFFSDLFDF